MKLLNPKRWLLIVIISAYALTGRGQVSLDRKVVATTGTSVQTPSLSLSYTLGEFGAGNSRGTNSLKLHPGFQQTENGRVYVWNGSVSSAWQNPLNWTPNGVPNSPAHSVVIPSSAARMPEIISDVQVNHVSLQGGVSIPCSANWKVAGNWSATSDFSIITGTGRIEFNGNSKQIISGKSRINYLLINLSGVGVYLQNNRLTELQIGEAIELQRGALNTHNRLTLLSTGEQHCAYIDNFSPGFRGLMRGKIYAQRYTAGSGGGYQLLSSPVNLPVVANLGVALSGTDGQALTPTANCDETQLHPSSAVANVLSWDEDAPFNPSNCFLSKWLIKSSGNLLPGTGYAVRRDTAAIFSLYGVPLTGDLSVSGCTNSNWSSTSLQNNTYSSGWNLLGNPYPSSLQMQTVPAGFGAIIQVYEASGLFSGTYQPRTIGVDAGLAPFQGFYARVLTPGNTATFVFKQNERSTVPFSLFRTSGAPEVEVRVLHKKGADKTVLHFTEQPPVPEMECIKIPAAGQGALIGFTQENVPMSIACIQNSENWSMPFVVNAGEKFDLQLIANHMPGGIRYRLENVRLHTLQDWNPGENLPIDSEPDAGLMHFVLHAFQTPFAGKSSDLDWNISNRRLKLFVQRDFTGGVVKLYNMEGKHILENTIEHSGLIELPVDHLPSGVYVVKLQQGGNILQERIVIGQ